MIDFQKPIPQYLIEKKNILRLVLFTSLFALVFINAYSPFGASRWYNVTRFQFFTYSSLTILVGVLVVVISRILMYHVCKKHIIRIWQYLLWIFAENIFHGSYICLFRKILFERCAYIFRTPAKFNTEYCSCPVIAILNFVALFFMAG